MDQEIIKYRNASFKGKLLLSKKFSKFYLNDFKPITELEDKDVSRARHNYRGFTLFSALTFGYMSFKYRRMQYSMIEAHEAPRDLNLIGGIINDALSVFFGYMLGHLFACDYIYKKRPYVIERLAFER